jgi:hypothetical protein
MSTQADTANRIVLLLLGLLVLTAGGLGLALSLGAWGSTEANGPVLSETLRDYPDDNPWFWWAVAGVAILTAVLCLLWLRAQLRTRRVSRVDRTTDPREGTTTIHAAAIVRAVEDEVDAIPGVTSASARVHDNPRLRLALTVDMTDTTDIGGLRTHIEDHVVAHLRQAVADPDLPVDIELRPDVRRTPARTVA